MKTSSFAREPSAVEGVLYTNNLLFEAHRQSKIRCAEMCATKDGCVTVTFTPPTSLQPSTCRGYSAIVTPSDPSQPSPGTQVYRIAGTRCLNHLRSTFSIVCGCYLDYRSVIFTHLLHFPPAFILTAFVSNILRILIFIVIVMFISIEE